MLVGQCWPANADQAMLACQCWSSNAGLPMNWLETKQSHTMGIHVGGFAHNLDVKANWRIHEINDQPFNEDVPKQHIKGTASFTIVFMVPNVMSYEIRGEALVTLCSCAAKGKGISSILLLAVLGTSHLISNHLQ